MFSSSRSRTSLSFLAGITALIVVLTACGSDSDEASTSTTMRFGYVGAGVNSQVSSDEVGYGLQRGTIQPVLAKYGIDKVETTAFLTGPDLNESVLSGRVDVTSSGDTPALIARGAKGPTRLLAIPSYMESIIITKNGGPTDIYALAGKKIAVVKGSTMHRFLVGVLAKNRVTADIVNINSSADSIAALDRGEIDAMATVSYLQVVNAALSNGFQEIVTAADYNGLLSLRVNTVTDSFLGGHSDIAEAWKSARAASLADIQSDPAAYFDWLAGVTELPRDQVEKLYPLSSLSEELLPPNLVESLTSTKQFLVDEKLIRNDFDVQKWEAS